MNTDIGISRILNNGNQMKINTYKIKRWFCNTLGHKFHYSVNPTGIGSSHDIRCCTRCGNIWTYREKRSGMVAESRWYMLVQRTKAGAKERLKAIKS